jgi:hypothetical protein
MIKLKRKIILIRPKVVARRAAAIVEALTREPTVVGMYRMYLRNLERVVESDPDSVTFLCPRLTFAEEYKAVKEALGAFINDPKNAEVVHEDEV